VSTPEVSSAVPQRAPAVASSTAGGQRRALCVGIDRYPIKALAGCVADARLWASTLQRLNFQCDSLLDGDATYANIKAQLKALLSSARAGDVIVWQYSGHGTQVPDINGDEKRGDSPGQDEAICPVDLQSGRFLIDDEIGELLDGLQTGVNFTMFIDCCHSGTINRFGFGEPPDPTSFRDERPRFIPLTDDLKQAYLQFVQSQAGGSRAFTRSRKRDAIQQTSEVLFSACLSTEVAWESNGQGEFTIRATKLLADRGLGVSNDEFVKAVVAAFGPSPRQTPNMTCAAEFRSLPLLAPFVPVLMGGAIEANAKAAGRFGGLATALDAVARELRGL
jgi:Caspase domain